MVGLGRRKRELLFQIYIFSVHFVLLQSEEAPAALLIAHAAHLSEKKQTRRRAAYWYAIAASRLERCGIVRCSSHIHAYLFIYYPETSDNVLSSKSPRTI